MSCTVDPSIQRLVDALTAFDGIQTHGSCGGHPEPLQGGQWPVGTWYVKFRVDKSEHGWRALEFLAWLINHAYQRDEHHVTLYPVAPPPYLNTPGQVLSFALEGVEGEDPDALAECVNELRQIAYVPPTGRSTANRRARVWLQRAAREVRRPGGRSSAV